MTAWSSAGCSSAQSSTVRLSLVANESAVDDLRYLPKVAQNAVLDAVDRLLAALPELLEARRASAGKLTALRVKRTDGDGSEYEIPCDMAALAIGQSKLLLPKKAGTGTARNWNTVLKLRDLLSEP